MILGVSVGFDCQCLKHAGVSYGSVSLGFGLEFQSEGNEDSKATCCVNPGQAEYRVECLGSKFVWSWQSQVWKWEERVAFKAKEKMFYSHPAVLISHLFLKLHLFGLRSSSGGLSLKLVSHWGALQCGNNQLEPSMLTPRCQRLQQLCQELESESWTVHLGDQKSYGKIWIPWQLALWCVIDYIVLIWNWVPANGHVWKMKANMTYIHYIHNIICIYIYIYMM